MRIYILEDCEILRLALSVVFQKRNFEIVGASDSSGEACAKILQSDCQTLLIGLRLRNSCGLVITRRLRAAGSHICIIAMGHPTDSDNIQGMYAAGVDSLAYIQSSNDEIISTVLTTCNSETFCTC